MKFWFGIMVFLFCSFLNGQSVDIIKAKVVNYSMDNGQLKSMTVDMFVDTDGYVYLCNQKFQRFDGHQAEQIIISNTGNDEFFWSLKVDSLNFMLCNEACYLFNTKTKISKEIVSSQGWLFRPYSQDSNTIKIIEVRRGEFTYDRKTKEIIGYDSLDNTIFGKLFRISKTEKLHANKIFTSDDNKSVTFFDKDYKKRKKLELDNPLINYSANDSMVILLTDRLSLYATSGEHINSIPFPPGTQSLELSDICKFSDHEYLINLDKGLFVFDIKHNAFTHEIRNIYNQPLIINEYIRAAAKKDQTLHLLTHFSGYYRIQFQGYELTSFLIPEGNTSIKAMCTDYENNRILIANQTGDFFQFDQNGNYIQKIEGIPTVFTAHCIIKSHPNEYILCNSKGCYKLVFSNYRDYTISTLITGNIGTYYTNIYEYKDTINIFTQTLRIQIPKGDRSNIKIKETNYSAFLINIGEHCLSWSEDSDFIFNTRNEGVDSIAIAPQLGGPVTCKALNDTLLLIGSRKGLYTLNLNSYSITDFEQIDDWVYAIEIYKDYFFCSTNQGVIIVKDGALIKRFTKADGINSNEFNTGVSFTDNQGRMYFGGASGAISFHPSALLDFDNSLKTSPTSFIIDGNKTASLLDKKIVLPPGSTNLSFRLSTIGAIPSIEYDNQYMIPEISDTWINIGKGSYANLILSPGAYTVYYHASTFYDPNALPGDFFMVTVKEFWYKKKLFYLLALLLINALVIGFFISYYRLKSGVKIKELAAKEKLNSEKMRISRDLHDSLGTQMAMVGRNIDWLQDNLEHLPEKEIKKNLNSILEVSMDTNQNLRDSIWAFKQPTFTTLELVSRIRNLLDRYRKLNHECQFELQQEIITDHDLSPSISLNLIRIIQESLSNALKHSQSDKVMINIKTTEEILDIIIQDNGAGFDKDLISRGQGLDNIEDRAESIGATLNLQSIIDVGTKIRIQIKIL